MAGGSFSIAEAQVITRFDRQNLKDVRRKLDEALAVLTKETGVRFSVGNIRFTENTFRTRLEANVGGSSEAKEDKRYDTGLSMFGISRGLRGVLTDADIGATFKFGGKAYKIVGVKPRSHKFPILGQDARGKTYKFPLEQVVFGLGRKLPDTYINADDAADYARESRAEARAEGLVNRD